MRVRRCRGSAVGSARREVEAGLFPAIGAESPVGRRLPRRRALRSRPGRRCAAVGRAGEGRLCGHCGRRLGEGEGEGETKPCPGGRCGRAPAPGLHRLVTGRCLAASAQWNDSGSYFRFRLHRL